VAIYKLPVPKFTQSYMQCKGMRQSFCSNQQCSQYSDMGYKREGLGT